MSGVQTVSLGEVATFVRGITFKPDDVVAVGTQGTVACMRTKNVQDELDLSDVWGVPDEFVRREEQHLQEGDILISSANSWNLVGKCSWVPALPWRASFGGFVTVLRALPERIDPRFLYRWFSSGPVQATLRSFGQKTTNISNLNLDRCRDLRIPLPPLPEQRRIAAILDQADTLRTQRRAALAQLDSLIQSLFIDMFGDPVTNPKVLPKRQLGDLMKFKSGDFLPASQMKSTGLHPVYGGNGINGHHDTYMFKEPRIVIGRVGAYCGCVHTTLPMSWITDNALYADKMGDEVDFGYIAFALGVARLNQYASQSGQPLVSGSRLYPVELLLPPLPLQQSFATRVQAIEALKAQHRAALAALDALFASLQQRAFAGKL